MTLAADLRVRSAGRALGPACGWFLAGADPARWLDELAGLGPSLLGLRCYLVPGDSGDLAGVFVLTPDAEAARPSPRAFAFRRLGDRVYLPVDAELDPPLSREELAACPGDPLVLHPAWGWVEFAPGDALGPAELLAPPPRRDSVWDCARAGPAPLPPLRGLQPDQPPSLERMFRQARREIGVDARPEPEPSEADAAQEASSPPQPPESPAEGQPDGDGWWQRQVRRVRGWFQGEPAPPDAPEPDAPSPEPAAPPPEPVDPDQLRRDRERELRRLAQLLAEDPDQGLRRALPLGARGPRAPRPAGRPPARRLPERQLRLNLDSARQGGAGEAWEVSPELHLLLLERYREAANRELALGRYERAAYVFLELLGDTRAAASALEQGRHYPEAALLYQERLSQPLEAARCLERGGLLEPAAELFGECGEHQQAAGLYRRLGQEEVAQRHYRRAVEGHVRAGDAREAARLLEHELGEPDEALALLADAWLDPRQPGACLRDRFELLGRLGRHPEAERLTRELVDLPPPPRRTRALVEALEHTARCYPEPGVADLARDGVRVATGRRLQQLPAQEAEELLRLVSRSAPHDPLLARDVGRYVARLRGKSPKPAPRGGTSRELETVSRIQLPRDVDWRTVAPAGRGFYAAGVSAGGLCAVRGRWDGLFQTLRWDQVQAPSQLLLAPAAAPSCPSVLVPVGQARLPLRRFPADDAFAEAGRIGTPGWIPQSCVALASSPAGVVFAVHRHQHTLVLSSLDALHGGAVLRTRWLGAAGAARSRPAVQLLALRDHLSIAVGTQLELRRRDDEPQVHELDGEATGLAASPREPCLVVTHAAGATAFFSRPGGRVVRQVVGRDLERPRAAFTREGLLALFAAGEVRCYELQGLRLLPRGTFRWRGPVLGLAPTRSHRFLAVFEPGGTVRVTQLPAL